MPTEREIEAGAKAVCRKFAKVGSCGRAEEFKGKCERCREYSSIALEAAERERWQPIETAPKDETHIIAVDTKGDQWLVYWRGANHLPHQDKPGWFQGIWRIKELTHWMPLRKSPIKRDRAKAALEAGKDN